MKVMTCHQLGGACDLEFKAETFEQMAELSKQHGTEMFIKKDEAHLQAMEKMKTLMTTPDKLQAWFDDKRKLFESLPHL